MYRAGKCSVHLALKTAMSMPPYLYFRWRLPWRQRLLGLAFDAVVVMTFGGVWISAGHAMAPLGLIMLLGTVDAWGLPMEVGWVAIGFLVIATILPWNRLYGSVVLAGLATLAGSWWIFVSQSGSIGYAWPLSIPFLATLVARVVYLVREFRDGAKPV